MAIDIYTEIMLINNKSTAILNLFCVIPYDLWHQEVHQCLQQQQQTPEIREEYRANFKLLQ